MGLDMYLSAKLYLSKYSSEGLKETREKLFDLFKEFDRDYNTGSIEVSVHIGYWRKANAIHRWFVENVQEGVDDCNPYYVSRKQLKKLKTLCETIVKTAKLGKGKVTNGYTFENDKKVPILEDGNIITNIDEIQELLPTQEGFFFGITEYNENYIWDLKNTIEIIDNALKLSEDIDFEYRSSW